MVSVGGIVVTSNTTSSVGFLGFTGDGVSPADPWPQGLGVFDLTEMEWKSEYDPSAEPYVSPGRVRTYNQQHGRFPVKWTNPIVEAWFTGNSMSEAELAWTAPC